MTGRPLLFVGFFLIIFCQNLVSQENKPLVLSLADAEKLAFKNNFSIRGAELSLKVSKARYSQASHAKILPKFQLRNVWGPVPRARAAFTKFGVLTSPDTSTGLNDLRYFTQLDVDLVQPLFTFGKFSNLSRAGYYGLQADRANLDNEHEKVKLQVRQLYWGLVLGKELLAVVEDASKELAKAEHKVEKKLDEGSEDVSQIDLFKLQLFRYDVDKRRRETLDKIALAKSSLKTVLGIPEDVEIEAATEYLDPIEVQIDNLPAYLETGQKNRFELKQLRAGIGASRALIGVAKSDYFPQFFFGGSVKANFAQDRFDSNNPFVYNPTNFFRPGFVFGASLNLNFLQTSDKVKVAQAQYHLLAEKERLLNDGIRLDVQKAYRELRQAEQNMRASGKAVKASDNWLRSATMTFDIGVGEVKDLIDAFKANGAMQAENLQNIFKYNVAVAKLSKAVGRDLYPK
ncbi:MAG: TolC family protein [bacterium]